MKLKNKVFWILTIIFILFLFIVVLKFDFWLSKDHFKVVYNIGFSYIAAYVFYIIQQFIPETIKSEKAYKAMLIDVEEVCTSIETLLCIIDKCLSISKEGIVTIKKRDIYCRQEESKQNSLELAWAKHFMLPDCFDKLQQDIEKKISDIKNHPFYVNTEVVFIETLENINRGVGKYLKNLKFLFKYNFNAINTINTELTPQAEMLKDNITKLYNIFEKRNINIRKFFELTKEEIKNYEELLMIRKKDIPTELESMAYICIPREKDKGKSNS